jgi:hypothetical protein
VVFFCLISLVSSFAKEETRETRRKEKKEERLPQSRWAFWRNGSFASSAQTVSRLLGETAGTNPVRKSDSTGFARLFRWWAVVVCALLAVGVTGSLVGIIVRLLLAVRIVGSAWVAVIVCGRRLFSHSHGTHCVRNKKSGLTTAKKKSGITALTFILR